MWLWLKVKGYLAAVGVALAVLAKLCGVRP